MKIANTSKEKNRAGKPRPYNTFYALCEAMILPVTATIIAAPTGKLEGILCTIEGDLSGKEFWTD